MAIKANFSAYSSYVVDSLHQWDLNQVLTVEGLNLATVPEVHFSNKNMDRAIVRQATMTDHVVRVNIPNSLLQDPLRIYAHVGIYEGSTFKVVEAVEIPVIPRTRPSDYQIADTDDEVYSFKALENKLQNKADATKINARVDNIIAHNNDTNGNTELVDLRVDGDGTVYSSAGASVRSQAAKAADPNRLVHSYNLNDLHTAAVGYFLGTDDEVLTLSASQCYTDYIPVASGEQLIARHPWGAQFSVSCYDAEKRLVSQQSYTEDTPISGTNDSISAGYWHLFTVPNGVAYLRFNVSAAETVNSMIVRGSSADDIPTEYVAYDGTIDAPAYVNVMVKETAKRAGLVSTEDNTVIGSGALPVSEGIRENVAIGAYAMEALKVDTETDSQSGRYNVAIGKSAMRRTTTGNHNTAVGFQTMMDVTTGSANTAVGEDAMMTMGAGERNVAIGCRALQSATAGDDNVAIGQGAGYWSDDLHPTGSRNTMVGAHSGQTDGAGSDNVAIGYFAKATNGLNHTIVIGGGITAQKDGQTIIGNGGTVETLVMGDFIVHGTDGVKRQIVFNADGTCSWLAVS